MASGKTRLWNLYWAPSYQFIGVVYARDASEAKRKAPSPYRNYLGEIRAEEVR
jgi:hypothetical protein